LFSIGSDVSGRWILTAFQGYGLVSRSGFGSSVGLVCFRRIGSRFLFPKKEEVDRYWILILVFQGSG
jgi:hypothetical protein